MQALCLMLLLVGAVMGGPVSTQPDTDSPASLSSTVDDLGSTGGENQALGDVIQALGNSGMALGDTDLYGDAGLNLGDNSLTMTDMMEVYSDDELVPLVLLIPRITVNNLHQIYCGEDCERKAKFPGQTGTSVVTRKKRALGAAFRAIIAAVKGAGRATAAGAKTAARKTATARRVISKVATQVERGTLLYFVIDQANQLAKLQQETAILMQQLANANSRQEKESVVKDLKEKRQEAVNILDAIDQAVREVEEADNS